MPYQNPRRPSRPIPQTPNLMNTIPPGVPGINAPIPPQMPIPPTPDLMNTIPPYVPGIDPREPIPGQMPPMMPQGTMPMPMPPHTPAGGGFQKPTYGNTHGARAPITNTPRQGGLLGQIIGNMRAKRQTRRGR